MTIVPDGGTFHDDGQRDARRYLDRVRKAIAERLRERIGEERLITAGPDHRVRVPVKGTREYRFILDRGLAGGVGQGDAKAGDVLGQAPQPGSRAEPGEAGNEPGTEEYEAWLDREEVEAILFEQLGLPRLRPRAAPQLETESIEWNEIARAGPLLDKKATVRENLKRNAARGDARIGGFERDDLRYLTYREHLRPKTRAVVFMLMDVSGSMGAFEKRVARLFLRWSVRFLRARYTDVELVLVAHHVEARECTEDEFFTRVESGGTCASSAFDLTLELQRRRYSAAEWNVYVLYASDGDNQASDNPKLLSVLGELTRDTSLVGYLQIDRSERFTWGGPHLLGLLSGSEISGLVTTRVRRDEEIWNALKTIFAPEPEELAS
jgi:sporulation protein YhbH